jgi:uncharacterized repeat protein (TIGR01451 family)
VPVLADPNGRLVNYTLSSTNGTLTVSKGAPVVNWPSPTNIVYGTPLGTNQNDATSATLGNYVYSPTNGAVLAAGTNVLTVVFTAADTNYTAVNLTNSLVVTPAPLSVVANNAARGYGQTNPIFGGTLTGVVNGDNITAGYTTTAVTNSPAGSYAIVPVLADPNGRLVNYTLSSTNGTLTITNVAVTTADIAVFKTGPLSGIAGSNLVYTITVTNLGPSTSTNVIVSDLLPAGFTFVSAMPSTVIISNNIVSWPGFNLANNTKSNFTVTMVSAEGGAFTNIAFATSDTSDPNAANNDGSSTNSQVRTVVSSLADVAIFKTGSANVYAGTSLTYTITATNAGPSMATNVIVQDQLPATGVFQSASGGYSLSNGVVTWPSVVLAKGTTTNFTVVMTAPASGALTNIAFSTAATADPNPTNNNGSASGSRVSTSVTPSADLMVFLSGPTNVNVGDSFTYTITLTNGGLSTAANMVAADNLPASLSFVSATGGGVFSNNIITWPAIAAFGNGATTNFILTVKAPGLGQFTNVASAVSTTFDPNPANNDGSALASQIQTVIGSAQFGILAGTAVFNPQTGLYEEQVIVTNISATTVAGVRLYVGGLRSGVTLYNATGTTSGTPYVEYDASLNPGGTVTFALEFYDASRLAFASTLTAVAILPASLPSAGTNGVAGVSIFLDTRLTNDMRFVIEFPSVPGKSYTILYTTNLDSTVWNIATPAVTANANITQWYDDGPPKTISLPMSVNNRFYRVIQN